MSNIKFVKEPGYIYDLFSVFRLYFNRDFFIRPFQGYKKSEENMEHFQKVLDDFLPISDELLVFFYMPKNTRSFMTHYYFSPYREAFVRGDYSLEMVLSALNDYDQVICNLLRFYFRDITDEKLQECRKSLSVVNRLIKESDYSGDVKSALYAFFIEPVPTIQKLCYELMAKELQLSMQYERKYKEVVELQKKLGYDRIVSDMKGNIEKSRDLSQYDEVYVSVGITIRREIRWLDCGKVLIMIVGLDYEDYLERYLSGDTPVQLDLFGTAISEKNRIEILELMLRSGEVSQRDIQRELGMSPTNVYYHILLMLKANLLRRRNQGRTILYSINRECVGAVISALSKYV